MLSCLSMLSCPRCGSGNLKDKKITQHASYLILHGSKSIVPCTKRHIDKEVQSWIDALRILSIHLSTTIYKVWLIDTIAIICHKDIPHNRKWDITYAQFWIKMVLKFFWNIFIISIHGLVYFHQNTKHLFVEFTGTKDAISLKQHQWFFLDCIVLIIVDDVNVKVISITCICFIQ